MAKQLPPEFIHAESQDDTDQLCRAVGEMYVFASVEWQPHHMGTPAQLIFQKAKASEMLFIDGFLYIRSDVVYSRSSAIPHKE